MWWSAVGNWLGTATSPNKYHNNCFFFFWFLPLEGIMMRKLKWNGYASVRYLFPTFLITVQSYSFEAIFGVCQVSLPKLLFTSFFFSFGFQMVTHVRTSFLHASDLLKTLPVRMIRICLLNYRNFYGKLLFDLRRSIFWFWLLS